MAWVWIVPGLGLWLRLVFCEHVCPTAANMVCAKFVPVYKLLWDDSSAGDEPCMAVGTETGGIVCLPPCSSLICC